jgi:hypothetical protein
MLLLERIVESDTDYSDIMLLTKDTVRRVIDKGNGTVVILFANGKAYKAHSDNEHPVVKADDVVAKLFRNDKDGSPFVISCTKIEKLVEGTHDW